MAKALLGYVGGSDPRLLAEMRRLQQRVQDLESELVRIQAENDALRGCRFSRIAAREHRRTPGGACAHLILEPLQGRIGLQQSAACRDLQGTLRRPFVFPRLLVSARTLFTPGVPCTFPGETVRDVPAQRPAVKRPDAGNGGR